MKKKWMFLLLAASASVMLAAGGQATKKTQANPKAAPQAGTATARVKTAAPSVQAEMLSGLPPGWATLKNITNRTAHDNEVAVGAVDANSNAFCVWTEWFGSIGDQRNIDFATNKSGAWSTPYGWPLDYPDISDVGFPALAVTTDGATAVVAYHDGDLSLSLMTVKEREYSNGTWSAIKNLSGASEASSYVTLSTNPVDNTIFAVWMADLSPMQLKYKYRDPSTGQWSGGMLVNTGAVGGQYLPNLYVDKNGTAHLVYIVRNGNASVWYTKNTNPRNATGWTAPLQLTADSGLNFTYPKVTADWDGNAYAVWQQIQSGLSSIMLRYMVDGAWGAAANISNLTDPSETAYPAVNGLTKEMYFVWQTAFGFASGNTNWDCCMKTYEIDKTTGQKAWSEVYRITSYPGHAGEPQIKIQKDGDLHVFFFDNLPPGDGAADIFYSYKLAPRLAAVAAPTVTSKLDEVLFAAEKWNTITFAKNTNNDDTKLQEYRLYRRKAEEADTAFALLTTLNVSTFQYVDKHLPPSQRYAYMVSVVNKDGLELKSAVTIEP
jgi:hypothetical protein